MTPLPRLRHHLTGHGVRPCSCIAGAATHRKRCIGRSECAVVRGRDGRARDRGWRPSCPRRRGRVGVLGEAAFHRWSRRGERIGVATTASSFELSHFPELERASHAVLKLLVNVFCISWRLLVLWEGYMYSRARRGGWGVPCGVQWSMTCCRKGSLL